jgi:hypothetical protein
LTVGEILNLIVILVAAAAIAWPIMILTKEARAAAESSRRQSEVLARLADGIADASKRLVDASQAQSRVLENLERKVGGSLDSLQSVLVDSREVVRAGFAGMSSVLGTQANELNDLRKAALATKDAVREGLDATNKSAEKTQAHLKSIETGIEKLASNTDEVGRLLHRAADSLLSKVVDQLAKNGQAIESLRKAISDDVASLSKE